MTIRTMSGTQRSAGFVLLLALTAPSGVFAHGHGHGGFASHGGPAHGGDHSTFAEHGGSAEERSPAFVEHGESAEERGPSAFTERGDLAEEHFDARFSHDHSYLDRGYTVHETPREGFAIDHERDHYWYDRGDWYRREGEDWMVAGAPAGAFVSVLPPFYTTVRFGGVPYYYANDTYYDWNGDQQQYEVVEPPAGMDSASTDQPPPGDAVFVYPRKGQSAQQQARDRYECHQSAAAHSGYDPTQTGTDLLPEVAADKRADYLRDEAACLDTRHYDVR